MVGAIALALVLGGQHGNYKVFKELIATPPAEWIQQPVTLKQMRGKVVLLDFWDYSCVNCIRTLPYLKEWYRRYHKDGLEIVGIHVPEFAFEKDPKLVSAAVKRFGLPYHILNDPQHANWSEYEIWAWPTKVLLGPGGNKDIVKVGEGGYDQVELSIQQYLHALHPALKFPPVMTPIRGADIPGAVCYPKTPEIFLRVNGFTRTELSYARNAMDTVANFTYPANKGEGIVYLSGPWMTGKHYLEAPSAGSRLLLRYAAKEANVVLEPSASVEVEVLQNGKPLDEADLGDDVHLVNGHSILKVSAPRMYSLVKNRKWGHYTLELVAKGAGLRLVTFSFSSDCETPTKYGVR